MAVIIPLNLLLPASYGDRYVEIGAVVGKLGVAYLLGNAVVGVVVQQIVGVIIVLYAGDDGAAVAHLAVEAQLVQLVVAIDGSAGDTYLVTFSIILLSYVGVEVVYKQTYCGSNLPVDVSLQVGVALIAIVLGGVVVAHVLDQVQRGVAYPEIGVGQGGVALVYEVGSLAVALPSAQDANAVVAEVVLCGLIALAVVGKRVGIEQIVALGGDEVEINAVGEDVGR